MSLLRTPNAEYGHLALLEVGKGAGAGAGSAWKGRSTGPCAIAASDALRETVREIKKDSDRVGLVGACVSDYPWIGGLMQVLEEEGLGGLDLVDPRRQPDRGLVSSLRRGGHRTLTVAPEAGTERLRHVIRKDISDAQLYEACDLVRQHGIPNLKCYFMIGLPTETDEDIEAIPDLAARLLARLKVASTQGEPVRPAHPVDQLLRAEAVDAVPVGRLRSGEPAESKLRTIKAGVRRLHNVRVLHENPREAFLRRSSRAGIAGSRTSSRTRRAARATGARPFASGGRS